MTTPVAFSGVHEVRGQDQHVVARDGVRDVLADQSLAR